MTDHEIREMVVHHLRAKGYGVTDLASGSGVPRLSRLEIIKDGKKLSCAIKTTRNGRISFTRNKDGSYKVLSDVDVVVHARLIQDDHPKVRISVFDRITVQKAFEENYAALAAQGLGHIPLWINPETESSARMKGSGFQKRALWSHVVPISLTDTDTAAPAPTVSGPASEGGIMDRIRAMLSEHMGIRPELIEIDVRVKL